MTSHVAQPTAQAGTTRGSKLLTRTRLSVPYLFLSRRLPVWGVVLSLSILSAPVGAQTQAQQDRLDRLARYLVVIPNCDELGMQLATELPRKAEAALQQEAKAWGIDAEKTKVLWNASVARQKRVTGMDLEAVEAKALSDPDLRGVRDILLSIGRTCVAAAADPVFAGLVVAPNGYDVERVATDVSDGWVAIGGHASWQTPRIVARGDINMLAGVCRSKIGSARSDALRQEFGRSDDPRERSYYAEAFDLGLADPSTVSTAAGCNRALARLRVKAQ